MRCVESISKPLSSFLRKQESSCFGLDPRWSLPRTLIRGGDDRRVSWVLKWVLVRLTVLLSVFFTATFSGCEETATEEETQTDEEIDGFWIAPNPRGAELGKNPAGSDCFEMEPDPSGWVVADIYKEENMNDWETVRDNLTGIKYYIAYFEGWIFDPDTIRAALAFHRDYEKKIGIESGFATCNAARSLEIESAGFTNLQEALEETGIGIDLIMLDEWFIKYRNGDFLGDDENWEGDENCANEENGYGYPYMAEQACEYFRELQEMFPGVKFGLTESFPYGADHAEYLSDLYDWINLVKETCQDEEKEYGVTLTVVEMDNVSVPVQVPDYIDYEGDEGVRAFEENIKDLDLKYSMIYMSEEGLTYQDGEKGGTNEGLIQPPCVPVTNEDWSESLLNAAASYYSADDSPNIHMIQSWVVTPTEGLPEDEEDTFLYTAKGVMEIMTCGELSCSE